MAIPGILCLPCPALPAAPGRLLIPISSTLSPWGLGGMDEDWGYIVSHSTEVTLQEEGSPSSQAGHHGDLLPWNLPCPEGDRQNLPAQTSWPRGSCQHLGEGFGTCLGHVHVTQGSSTSGHQGWHRQPPNFNAKSHPQLLPQSLIVSDFSPLRAEIFGQT